MKLKSITLVLLAAMALIFSACKKSGSSQTTDPKTVSSQIALNLAQTLYGSFGGFSVDGGLSAPQTFGVDRNKIKLNLTKGRIGINDIGSDITCGLHVDTTFSTSVTVNGGQATAAGSIGFTFTCTNGTFSGFNVTDNLKVTAATAQMNGTFNIAENLTMAQITPGDDTSNISLNGTASFAENAKISGKTTVASFSYTFSNVIIDQLGTVAGGSASFTTQASGASGTWNYSGTATFLGNGNVKIVINGVSYNVNMQTGTVS